MKSILLGTLLTTMALALAGCRTHEGAYAAKHTASHDLENHSHFVLLDKGAQNSVTYSGIKETYLEDGRMQVAANVRNRDNRRIQVQVNCVFKDEHGFAVEESPFQNLFLDENAQETVQFVSGTDKARRYTIRVRQAR